MLGRTSRSACPLWGKIWTAAPAGRKELWDLQNTLNVKACSVHNTSHNLANPDNKPAPSGKEKNDPTNVKYDTPTKDPDDTSDYMPGYYEDKGKGGRREVGSGSGRVNPQEQTKHSHQEPVQEEKYKKEEHGDPARATPDEEEQSTKAVSDSDDRGARKDGEPPVGRSGKGGGMPDERSQSTGMPQPNAAPHKQEGGPYDPPEAEVGRSVASDIEKEGGVKLGKPAPARPDEPHKYKYQ